MGVSEDPGCFEIVTLKFKLLRETEQIRLRFEFTDETDAQALSA